MTADLNSKTYASIGSFWSQQLRSADRPLAKRLARTAFLSSDASEIVGAYLTGGACAVPAGALNFDIRLVAQIGGDLNHRQKINLGDGEVIFRPSNDNDWMPDGGFLGVTGEMSAASIPILSNPAGEFLLFPGGDPIVNLQRSDWLQQPLYLLPCDSDVEYYAFMHEARLLVAGLDFWRGGRNVLTFREDPRRLFPGGTAFFSGSRISSSAYSQVLRTLGNPGEHVWAWVRGSASSFLAYERAIAQAAGLQVVKADGVVSFTASTGSSRVYVVGDDVYRVGYAHEPMIVGQEVKQHDIIGGGVKVLRSETDPHWYRAVDWGYGLSLDALCPVKGVTVGIGNARATVVSDIGGLRVEFPLSGSAPAVVAYWAHVRRMEDLTQVFVADAFPDLTEVGHTQEVAPLEFFMLHMLGIYMVPVQIRLSDVSTRMQQAAEDFARSNSPTGGVVVLV